jgi:hypothetical protein
MFPLRVKCRAHLFLLRLTTEIYLVKNATVGAHYANLRPVVPYSLLGLNILSNILL